MIHFQPETGAVPAPYMEAVERLRSVRKALALGEMFDGQPRRAADDIGFEALFIEAPEAVQRCAAGRSVRAAGAAAAGKVEGRDFSIDLDRMSAIRALIGRAGPGDTVLLAGKGHEDYQDVAGEKRPFSDLQEALAALRQRTGAAP